MMPAPANIAKAESTAFSGESQDSQLILDAYLKQYGIGAANSLSHYSLEKAPAIQAQECNTPSSPEKIKPPGTTVERRDFARLPSVRQIAKQPDKALIHGLPHHHSFDGPSGKASLQRRSHLTSVAVTTREPLEPCPPSHLHHLPPRAGPSPFLSDLPSSTRMDFLDSPTQSNGSRSYEQYLEPSSRAESSPVIRPHDIGQTPQAPSQSSPAHELRSLKDDDTGAVNFNLVNWRGSHTAGSPIGSPPGSPVLGDTQVVDSHPLFPRFQPYSHPEAASPLPETPAPPQNPFVNSRSQLLHTSQLFKGTQPSSAVRHISPTSSRPSPNNFLHNSLSPDPVSSPIQTRDYPSSAPPPTTSSPRIAPWSAGTGLEGGGEEQHGSPTAKDPDISSALDSSPYPRPRTRSGRAPLDTYISMQKSQEQRSINEIRSVPASQTSSMDDDDDDAYDRRRRERRARLKKEAALKQLNSVSFTRRSRSDDIEVPSTNTKRRKLSGETKEQRAPRPGRMDIEPDSQAKDTIADSQDQFIIPKTSDTSQQPREPAELSKHKIAPAASSLPIIPPETATGDIATKDSLPLAIPDTDTSNGYAIPETSPIEKRPGGPSGTSPSDLQKPTQPVPNDVTSTPRPTFKSNKDTLPRSSMSGGKEAIKSSEMSGVSSPCPGPTADQGAARQRQSVSSRPPTHGESPTPSLTSSPPAFNIRGKRQSARGSVTTTPARQSKAAAPLPQDSSSSPLSTLRSTPSLSESTTPATQESPSPRQPSSTPEQLAAPSPNVNEGRTRRSRGLPSDPRITSGAIPRASSRLSARRLSFSTDELTRSSSSTPTAFERCHRNPRVVASKSKRAPNKSRRLSPRGEQSDRGKPRGLFEGMVFAISFQSRSSDETDQQYNERMKLARNIKLQISNAGGGILGEGFDELFENPPIKAVTGKNPSFPPDTDIKLKADARSLGFTALIADDHSRKQKYMQALALGLPCLAHRWVTTCLERNEIVDWIPYLLCAGRSKVLSEAHRSRNLAPYDAAAAVFADVVEQRPRLLAGSRILVILKKSEEAKKTAYTFLTRALGASLWRVPNLEEARARLKTAEDLGTPFDWVYVDENTDTGKLFVTPATTTAAAGGAGPRGRKRKREKAAAGGVASLGHPAPLKGVRFIGNELVIQSLILGRLIEEGEM